MNIFHGSPGSNITNASARAFATKGIIPEFRDCKWNYEEDPKGFDEFARNFKTVLEARFPEAVVLHSFIDHKAGRMLNIEMAEKVSVPDILLKAGILQDDDYAEPQRDRHEHDHPEHDQVSDHSNDSEYRKFLETNPKNQGLMLALSIHPDGRSIVANIDCGTISTEQRLSDASLAFYSSGKRI